mgnify:CR=1 FL=1
MATVNISLPDALKTFVDEYGRRGMARGAVVVIVSDGWANGTSSAAFDVVVRNVAPTITSMQANPAAVFVGESVTIVVTSTDPAGTADTSTCHLDFDDGNTLVARVLATRQRDEHDSDQRDRNRQKSSLRCRRQSGHGDS